MPSWVTISNKVEVTNIMRALEPEVVNILGRALNPCSQRRIAATRWAVSGSSGDRARHPAPAGRRSGGFLPGQVWNALPVTSRESDGIAAEHCRHGARTVRIHRRRRLIQCLLAFGFLVLIVDDLTDWLPAVAAPIAFLSIGVLLVFGLVFDAAARRSGS